MIRISLIAFTAVTLAACEAPRQSTVPTLNLPQSCGADEMQHLVGQPVTAFKMPRTNKDVRIIGPEESVTADYRAGRLNVEHDKSGIIVAISCY